jgi:hypothetical protein
MVGSWNNHRAHADRLAKYRAALEAGADPAIITLLREADPGDRAEVYHGLGLKLTYQNEKRLVVAEPGQTRHVLISVSEGGLEPPTAPL